jgi:putative oxidoreductase
MLNHIGLAQIVGVVALVAVLYSMRASLTRSAVRGRRESHPHSLAWMHRYRILVELVEVSLAVVFFLVGGAKLVGRHDMIVLFRDIGVGQWLRYLTGTLEVSGAALLLVPLLSGPSALALGGIMIVATLIELFVLHRPPVAALACLSGHTLVAWARLSPSRRGSWRVHDHFKLSPTMGKVRMRLPVAAKTALQTAGAAAGRPGSPKPVGGSVDLTK